MSARGTAAGSLRVRLTVWYTLALAIPLIGFAAGCWVVLARSLRASTDRFLDEAMTAFSREAAAERRWRGDPRDALASAAREVHFRDLRIVVRDAAGRLVAVSHEADAEAPDGAGPPDPGAPPPAWARGLDALAGAPPRTQGTAEGAWRVAARRVVLGRDTFRVVGAYPLREGERVLERLRAFLLVALPLLLASAAVGGAWLGRRGLAPLEAMAARAREISASRFDLRLPADGVGELRRVAEGVNDLLDRLQDAFARQRRFIADASHELRTPTAIIRSEAEVTLARAHRDEGSYRHALGVVHDAARRLDRVVQDLFLLARADAEPAGAAREPLYLEEVVHDTVRAVQPLGARRGVAVQVATLVPALVTGDADLLGRVLLNLLDNAIKHAPEGSAVTVSMTRTGGEVAVAVRDAGPGIPAEVGERVFDRFYRIERGGEAHAAAGERGAGLGLAIARRIVEAHGGRLELADARPGQTTFALHLPVVPGSDERGGEGDHEADRHAIGDAAVA